MSQEVPKSDLSGNLEGITNRAESYAKTVYELYKLKAVDKISEFSGRTTVYMVLIFILGLVITMISFGIAIWIGSVTGSMVSGFLLVAFFYLVTGIIILIGREKWIRKPVSNRIISDLLRNEH